MLFMVGGVVGPDVSLGNKHDWKGMPVKVVETNRTGAPVTV
jgi:hypothetical protein